MDVSPRWRGGEGYGVCFDDARAAGRSLLSKKTGLFRQIESESPHRRDSDSFLALAAAELCIAPSAPLSEVPHPLAEPFPPGQCCQERVALADAKRAADLLGDDDAAEVVDSSDNSGSFHMVSNPSCDLITLLSGSSDSTIIIRSCVQVIPVSPGAVFGGRAGEAFVKSRRRTAWAASGAA